MTLYPDKVRFHFARQAPSPWNWYTQEEFEGCALKWDAPSGTVLDYVIFRASENLPTDCCEELFDGVYDDVVDRLDVSHPINALVDDQIHDRNRYLVLAHLDSDEYEWIQGVESTRFNHVENGDGDWFYWSSGGTRTPRHKDPCRLDYLNVRVGDFCGLMWNYPENFRDLLGYDLIVSDVPVSPHTGNESDIEAFNAVLNGENGSTIYALEPYVNCVIDNCSQPNRFWYYALLVRLPDHGRVQIPLNHTPNPYPKGIPFQNLDTSRKWGEGREIMEFQYNNWNSRERRPEQLWPKARLLQTFT